MEKSKDLTNGFYRVCYALFIVLALYQIIFKKDFIEAATSLGIALIFDPFNRTVSWPDRPMWQRIWTLSQLFVAAALLGYGISLDF